ncbi:MAG: serine hydrolase domain-containing protein [Promethearchaeota archaeon]
MVEINKDTVTQIISSLEPMLGQMMTGMNLPSVNLAVTNKSEILFAKSYGVKDLETKTPPSMDTIYMIGSCSKTYCALAVMQLVEQGKIDLTAPVSKYIPFTLGTPENPITVKHLLTHNSGLSDIGMAKLLIDRIKGEPTKDVPYTTWEDFYSYTNGASNELVDLPGKRFIYSNTGFTLLAQIVASVSQMTYEDYVQEYIFNPLNMKRSCFRKDQLDTMSDIATQYFTTPSSLQASVPYHEPIIAGCGGVISSVLDQVKYLQMLLNMGKSGGQQIISQASLEEMEKAHVKSSMATGLLGKGFGPEAYGYGWMVFSDFCGVKIINHAGSTGNGSANLFYSHDLDIGVVGTSNNENAIAVFVLISFLLSAALKDKNPMTVFPALTLDGVYGNLQGIYSGYKEVTQFQVRYQTGLLYLDMLGADGKPMGMERPLIPVNDSMSPPYHFHVFNGAWAREIIEFTIDEQGKVHMFDMRNFSHKIRNL